MPRELSVHGLTELLEELKGFETHEDVFILFTGSKDGTGKSWCPDCNDADPVIKNGLKNAPDDSVFITCTVGERSLWKDPENEFRKHLDYKLTGIPTLIKWKSPKRLGPDDCKKQNLVDMIFED